MDVLGQYTACMARSDSGDKNAGESNQIALFRDLAEEYEILAMRNEIRHSLLLTIRTSLFIG